MITCFGDKTYCAGTQNKDETPTFTPKATEPFTFHCRVYGHPRPRRYWARVDGAPLPADVIDDNNGTLTIPRLRYPEDTGDYICLANNTWGADIKRVTLNVIRKNCILFKYVVCNSNTQSDTSVNVISYFLIHTAKDALMKPTVQTIFEAFPQR